MSQAQVWEKQALAISVIGGIANRIKLCVHFARKNRELAMHDDFKQFVDVLFEQLLPRWLRK